MKEEKEMHVGVTFYVIMIYYVRHGLFIEKEHKIFLVKWINSLEFRSGKTMILVNIISSFHGDKKK